MIGAYGSKKFKKLQGYVADYCETCRRITEFKVEEVVLAPFIYFIRLGGGIHTGNSQTCHDCKMEFDAYTARFQSFSKTQGMPVDQLARETFPAVYEIFKGRLERNERARKDSALFDAAEREKALLEIFSVASTHFQQRDRATGLRVLVNGLNPLAPTEEELRGCLSLYRDGKHSLGALRSADLLVMVRRKELSADRY